MTTFLLTSPATELSTGRRGTLVLTDQPGQGRRGGARLILTADPQRGLHGPTFGRAVRMADVEWVEITGESTVGTDGFASPPPSVVTLHLRNGSDARYRLARSNPALLRRIFAEAGWPRPCRSVPSSGLRLRLTPRRLEMAPPRELAPTGTG